MADILCGYTADRDETLTAYLYDDIEPAQRAAFEAHIATCERCRQELSGLQGVRGRLKEWTTPVPARPLTFSPASATAGRAPGGMPGGRLGGMRVLRELPAWAHVAAAVLVLGASAGLANLDVRYDRGAITLRTGWSRPAPPAASTQTSVPADQWRADLASLERRLRTELRPASPAATPAATPAAARTEGPAAGNDAEVLRKVRALLDASERRQRNELALQIADVVREFDTKRGSDLANIRSMKTIQSATGVEIVRQQQWLDLLTRASIQK